MRVGRAGCGETTRPARLSLLGGRRCRPCSICVFRARPSCAARCGVGRARRGHHCRSIGTWRAPRWCACSPRKAAAHLSPRSRGALLAGEASSEARRGHPRRPARRGSPLLVELGEVTSEGRVLKTPAREPSVEAPQRPGVRPMGVRAPIGGEVSEDPRARGRPPKPGQTRTGRASAPPDRVVCGRGRNTTLSVSGGPTVGSRPAVFAGQVDVLPAERRDVGQEFVRDLEPGLAPRS